MSPKSIFISIFFFLNAFVGISQNNTDYEESLFNESLLLQNLKSLSSDAFEGRRTGTNGAIKSRKYIVNQFHSFGVLPLGKTFEQFFSFVNQRKEYKGVNILGLIKGTENPKKYIVISAHYDHEGIKKGQIYNGADDNASGLCALFSFAEYFKTNPPRHSVILAAFDAEELGLQGSKYYVNNSIIPLRSIHLNLNMDMIGRSDANELYIVGSRYNKSLDHAISNLKTVKNIKLLVGHDGEDRKENWTYSSDHASFYKTDIPFLYFGVEDHKDYHEPTDDFENIHPQFYIEAVKTIISIFNKVDTFFN